MVTPDMKKGIEILDTVLGKEWREQIDLNRLNQSNYKDCILGQLFGSYSYGLDLLFARGEEPMDIIGAFGSRSSTELWKQYLTPSLWQRFKPWVGGVVYG